jgi:hypothetical protein
MGLRKRKQSEEEFELGRSAHASFRVLDGFHWIDAPLPVVSSYRTAVTLSLEDLEFNLLPGGL